MPLAARSTQWDPPVSLSWVVKNEFTTPHPPRPEVPSIPWFIVHFQSMLYESKSRLCFAQPPRRAAVSPFLSLCELNSEARAAFHRAYTGYVDIGTRHLFFTFVESQREPANDDVVILVSGGEFGDFLTWLVDGQSIRNKQDLAERWRTVFSTRTPSVGSKSLAHSTCALMITCLPPRALHDNGRWELCAQPVYMDQDDEHDLRRSARWSWILLL